MRRVAGRIPGFSLSRGESSPEVCLGRLLAGFQSGEETGVLRNTLPLEKFFLAGEHIGHAFGGDKAGAERQREFFGRSAEEHLEAYPHIRLVTEEGVLLLDFSYSYFSSFFRAHIREGFNAYLNKVRVRHAEVFLQEGEPVSSVYGRVGYGDQSYFTKVFKKYTGCTPGDYRREGRP